MCSPRFFQIVLVLTCLNSNALGDDPWPVAATTFLEQHCHSCHAGEEAEAGLDLRNLSNDLTNAGARSRWELVHDRVASGEMPPPAEARPPEDARARFLTRLRETLTRADAARRRVVLRRLNRLEYENTVRDLLGIDVEVRELFPPDASFDGFDNNGSALSLSAEHLETYLAAADRVLDAVFGPPREPRRVRVTANLRTTALEEKGIVRGEPDGVVLFNSGNASSHDNRNLPILLAGGGFRHGAHLAFDRGANQPLANLYVSMLRRLGLDVDHFASSTGTLPGLS